MTYLTHLNFQNIDKPKSLDAISFMHEGIQFHVYGVLHGLTGGTNKEYRDLVHHTISKAPGLIMGEKKFRTLYPGICEELHDWIQISQKDAFLLSLFTFLHPFRILNFIRIFTKELVTKQDRFNQEDGRLQDIGGSPYFHSLDPYFRRQLAGFKPPLDYLKINLLRRANNTSFSAPKFPDPDWAWLTSIEPYANIPCRSIHMLEYATATAKFKNAHTVSLFVGEIHNTDMDWYRTSGDEINALEPWMIEEIASIKKEAISKASVSYHHLLKPTLAYQGFLTLGMAIPLFFWMFLISKIF